MPDTRIAPATAARIAAAWPELLDKIAAGAQIGKTIAAAGFSRDMVRKYLQDDPGARKSWDEAREASADAFFDAIQDLIDNPGSDPKSARVKLQGLQWLAAKRNPRAYSDRVDHNVTVRTIDLTRVIEAANARLAEARAGRVIEGQVLAPALLDLL